MGSNRYVEESGEYFSVFLVAAIIIIIIIFTLGIYVREGV